MNAQQSKENAVPWHALDDFALARLCEAEHAEAREEAERRMQRRGVVASEQGRLLE